MQAFVDKKRKNFLEGFFVKMALAAPTTAPHEGLTCWMEEQITDLEKFNKNKLGELFYDLPVEMQTRIFSFLAPMPNSSDTLQAAAAVNRHWRFLAEEPKLWAHFRPVITDKTSAEELVAALQFRRFSQVDPNNFHIKASCQKLSRSEINFGLQTRVEALEGLDIELLARARRVLRTPEGKVALHEHMKQLGPNGQHQDN